MKTISLTSSIPRNIHAIQKDILLRSGLTPYFFFAKLFYAGTGLVIILVVILNPTIIPLLIIFIVFSGSFSYALLDRPARVRLRTRKHAFINGVLVNAIVQEKRNIWVPWKSWRDIRVNVDVETRDGIKSASLQTSDHAFADTLSIGDPLQALYDASTGDIFLPAEIGVRIEEHT